PEGGAPDGLKVQVLSEAIGPAAETGSTVVVNYPGQTWGAHVSDNSYDRGTTIDSPIGVGAGIGGWDKGMVGQNVGSRLMLSIPPEHGYGSRGVPQAGIGGTDTLVFVVDIVAVR